MSYVGPEQIYVCPKTGDYFRHHDDYCLDDPPCNYFQGIFRDGIGDSYHFDVVKCGYQSLQGKVNE